MNKKHIALFLLSFAASAALSSPICDDLAARQSAFFSEGGMIPIAYLESTGTQWIDLDLNSTADRFCDFDIVFRKTGINSTPNTGDYFSPFGYQYGASARYGIWGGTNNTVQDLFCGIAYGFNVSFSKDTEWHTLSVRNGDYIAVDGEVTAATRQSVRANINIALFAINRAFSGFGNYLVVPARISSFRIWDVDGNLLRDMVPVRINSEGFMYDLANDVLYGNDGTGSFLLGPDL